MAEIKFVFSKICLLIVILLFTNSGIAQQKQLDSLKLALKTAKHDTTRCNILIQLYEFASNDEAEKFSEQLKKIAEKNLKILSNSQIQSGDFKKNNSTKKTQIILFKKHLATALNDIGRIYDTKADIPMALEFYTNSLKMSEEIGNKEGISTTLNNIGFVYSSQGDDLKALEYFNKSLRINEEIKDKNGIATSLNNIGYIYFYKDSLTKALEYFDKSKIIREKNGDKRGVSESLNNIAGIYSSLGNNLKSLEYYTKSLQLKEEIGDKTGMTYALNNIGFVNFKQKNYKNAIAFCSKSMKLSKELNSPEFIKNAAITLNQIYKGKKDYKNALLNYELYIQMSDSISNQETKKASIKNQLKYQYDKKALADSIQLADTKKINKAQMAESVAKLKQQKTQRFALAAGLLLVLGFLGYTYKRFLHSNKQKLLIEEQKKVVDKSQKKIVDSINYAKKIQHSILPSNSEISAIFSNHYIFFKPKDIVSGDFYWFHHHNNLSFIAVADCTGHGVPGAFMTMIASSALNEVVIEQKNTEPDKILSSLHTLIFKSLQQHKGDEYSQDGMDISLAVIDHNNNLLHFSGAHNHGFLIDNGEIRTLKATSKSIGGLSILGEIEPQRSFKAEKHQLYKDTVLVLATDGIYDQLNSNEEKFGIQRFKDLILKLNSDIYLNNQNIIELTYHNWKQDTPQLDDVLLLTIKL